MLVASLMTSAFAQDVGEGGDSEDVHRLTSRDTLISVAREIMAAARFCTLVTLDESGRPHSRIMDPFAPEDDMVVWLGTKRASRKVREIESDPRVSLTYFDPKNSAYVAISGTARLVNDPDEKNRHWKERWESFYTDRDKDYLLIEVVPQQMGVIDVGRGIVGDRESWRSPVVEF